jgi:hypothetical protein
VTLMVSLAFWSLLGFFLGIFVIMALLFEVEWMASCGGFCNGELWSSYYLDIVINSIVSVEFEIGFGRIWLHCRVVPIYYCILSTAYIVRL